ncbi:putative baseplate assembly protein [Bradyrhizobium sp. 26S5]|uniref:putative baseplate assembly protein n=1 Tax=Bradyrhizobium sp. 26S5 TaxID=3139729 RepID=UPI0030D493AE
MRPPQLYDKAVRAPVDEAVAMAERYCVEEAGREQAWTGYKNPSDPGRALMELGARLVELLADRINRVPEKNLLAFLDLVGVERSPGMPAEAPVTFLLPARGDVGQQIPAGTQVATTQSENSPALIFETRNSFIATPAQLVHAVSVVPLENRFATVPLPGIPPTPEELASQANSVPVMSTQGSVFADVERALYIASSTLFERKEPVDVSLEFTIANRMQAVFSAEFLLWQRFDVDRKLWLDIENVTYAAGDDGKVVVKFANFPGTAKTEIAGQKAAWVVARLKSRSEAMPVLPRIGEVRGFIKMSARQSFQADAAAINDTIADLSKPIVPFGERPRYGDAFHIASGKGFVREVARATVRFTLRVYTRAVLAEIFRTAANTAITTLVEWQYLAAGNQWKTIDTIQHILEVTDGPDFHQKDGQRGAATEREKNGALFGTVPDGSASIEFSFSPAADIAVGEVGGISGRWIRAVLRSQNPYGRDGFAEMVPQSAGASVLRVVGPTFVPPVLERIEIEYDFAETPVAIDHLAVADNFDLRLLPLPLASAFAPFVPLSEYTLNDVSGILGSDPALYLGFDRKFGNAFISLFVALEEPTDTTHLLPETGNPNVVWESATSEAGWKPLDVQDGTANLTSSGIVGFQAPVDSAPLTLFPQLTGRAALCWYRVRLQRGSYAAAPRLKAVLINSVMADNHETIGRDWVLASGTGEPGLRATIRRSPVLAGEIWVRESEQPSAAELQDLLEELKRRASDEGIREVPTLEEVLVMAPTSGEAGGDNEAWVRWLRVPNFRVSGSRSRHYTLEAATGEVTFGDGTSGLIPPIGKDNIVVRGLRSGGGEVANRIAAPLAIKELKSSVPSIDKVFNYHGAVGGSDPWTLEQTFDLGPQAVKHRGRAVTCEDYVWITLGAFSQVARARCVPIKAPDSNGRLVPQVGAVSIVIVPKGRERTPQPTRGLLRRIETHLRARALGAISPNIHALPPSYRQVSISAKVHPSAPEDASLIEQRVLQALDAFFHPLSGGERGDGWPFGRSVYLSEVYAAIERAAGIDHVVDAKFADQPGLFSLPLDENELIASGSHQIEIV